MAFNSVKIDNKDLYTEYELILANKEIGIPEAQTKYIDIPMRDGSLDLTEVLTNSVKYKTRIIKMTFLYMGDDKAEAIKNVASAIHGKRLRIVFDDDSSYYYTGRISIDSANDYSKASKIMITAECDPLKRTVSTAQKTVSVSGTKTYTFVCNTERAYPVINVTADMQAEFDGITFNLVAGDNTIAGMIFTKGNNVIKFTGTGTVKIIYEGGIL